MRGSLTPKERASITELQDQLIVRFVNHRLAVAQGEEHQARALEMEIDELPSCCGRRRNRSVGRSGIGLASRFPRMTHAMSPPEPTNVVYEIRLKGRRLVQTTQLADAQRAVRAAAEAGEGAKIVDADTGQVIERHPPRRG